MEATYFAIETTPTRVFYSGLVPGSQLPVGQQVSIKTGSADDQIGIFETHFAGDLTFLSRSQP
jgi:hypothetical protein